MMRIILKDNANLYVTLVQIAVSAGNKAIIVTNTGKKLQFTMASENMAIYAIQHLMIDGYFDFSSCPVEVIAE